MTDQVAQELARIALQPSNMRDMAVYAASFWLECWERSTDKYADCMVNYYRGLCNDKTRSTIRKEWEATGYDSGLLFWADAFDERNARKLS